MHHTCARRFASRYFPSPALCLVGLLGLAGCVTTPPPPPPLPAWVANPPADDGEIFYGVGAGIDRDTAVQAALVDIAAKLSTTVNSSIDTLEQESVRNGQATNQSSSQRTINNTVQKITIADYQVAQTHPEFNRVNVLVQVRRSSLKAHATNELEESLARVRSSVVLAESSSVAKKITHLRQAVQAGRDARPRIALLKTLSPDYASAPVLAGLQANEKALQEATNQLSFRIEGPAAAAGFAEILRGALSQAGFRVLPKKEAGAVTISLQYSEKSFNQFSAYHSAVTIALAAQDETGSELTRATWNGNGRSSLNAASARENAERDVLRQIQAGDLLTQIGFKTDLN